MTRFELIFGRDGEPDQHEHRFNDEIGEPHIDGTLLVDGGKYVIRGVEWLLRRDDSANGRARFICTLVVEEGEADA